MSTSDDWQLQGSYFETCNCQTACPCVWLQPPTEGDCKLLVAWHIEKGHLQHTLLNNLNIALACYAPGHMKKGDWQAALYIDARANEAQTAALEQIFSGKQGGHPAVLMSFVSTVLGIKKVPIEFQEKNNQRQLTIPDIAQVEIEAIQGISGAFASITNPPLCIVPDHPSIVAKSSNYKFSDYDKSWSFSERNGYFSAFTYHP